MTGHYKIKAISLDGKSFNDVECEGRSTMPDSPLAAEWK